MNGINEVTGSPQTAHSDGYSPTSGGELPLAQSGAAFGHSGQDSIEAEYATTPIPKSRHKAFTERVAEIGRLGASKFEKQTFELRGVVALHLKQDQYDSKLYANGVFVGWVKGGDVRRGDSEADVVESINELLKRTGPGTITFETWPRRKTYGEPTEVDLSKIQFTGSDAS